MNEKIIRAKYDNDYINIYQAFNNKIAKCIIDSNFYDCPLFKKNRMSWIKPSFLWMMYRSGWATKIDQDRILCIKIKRTGFEWALKNSCLSYYDKSLYPSLLEWKDSLRTSPVRIQWDPEKDIFSSRLNYKSIQIGLSGIAIEKYISDWVVEVQDITEQCIHINQLVKQGEIDKALNLLPQEVFYSLPEDIALRINSSTRFSKF